MKESVFVPIVDERDVTTKKTGPGRRKQSIKRGQRRTRPRGRGKIVYFVLFFSFVVIIDVALCVVLTFPKFVFHFSL